MSVRDFIEENKVAITATALAATAIITAVIVAHNSQKEDTIIFLVPDGSNTETQDLF